MLKLRTDKRQDKNNMPLIIQIWGIKIQVSYSHITVICFNIKVFRDIWICTGIIPPRLTLNMSLL